MNDNVTMGIIVVLLIFLSSFFSAIETALSSANTIRLRNKAENGDKRAIRALKLVESYDKAITTILIGNNIVNIGCSSLATVLCISLFSPSTGPLISTIATTLAVLTFGEVLPKCFAKENADKMVLTFAGVLNVAVKIFSPLSFVFLKIKSLAMKLFNTSGSGAPSVTEDELKYIVESIEEEGVIEEQESELVQSALDFDEKTAQEILTHRVDVTAIDINDDFDSIKEIILKERYSRIPVYKDSIDNIIGILHTRDFLEELITGKTPDLNSIIQPAYFIYKTKKLSALLTDFKYKKLHIAIVADDYGGTLGIVTMEDLLEEIVGEIWDEDEEIEKKYTKLDNNKFEVIGDMDFDELPELLELDEKYFETDCNSVGGWILENLGYIPENGCCFDYKDLNIEITDVSEQRINKLIITKKIKETEENE